MMKLLIVSTGIKTNRRHALRSAARDRPGRRPARKVDTLPAPIMNEVLAKVATLFE